MAINFSQRDAMLKNWMKNQVEWNSHTCALRWTVPISFDVSSIDNCDFKMIKINFLQQISPAIHWFHVDSILWGLWEKNRKEIQGMET